MESFQCRQSAFRGQKVDFTFICFARDKKQNNSLHISKNFPNIAKRTFSTPQARYPNTKKGEEPSRKHAKPLDNNDPHDIPRSLALLG